MRHLDIESENIDFGKEFTDKWTDKDGYIFHISQIKIHEKIILIGDFNEFQKLQKIYY